MLAASASGEFGNLEELVISPGANLDLVDPLNEKQQK